MKILLYTVSVVLVGILLPLFAVLGFFGLVVVKTLEFVFGSKPFIKTNQKTAVKTS